MGTANEFVRGNPIFRNMHVSEPPPQPQACTHVTPASSRKKSMYACSGKKHALDYCGYICFSGLHICFQTLGFWGTSVSLGNTHASKRQNLDYLSIYLSIHPSIHLSIYSSIHLSIYLSTYTCSGNIRNINTPTAAIWKHVCYSTQDPKHGGHKNLCTKRLQTKHGHSSKHSGWVAICLCSRGMGPNPPGPKQQPLYKYGCY